MSGRVDTAKILRTTERREASAEALRREHPHLPLTVVEDGLASNGPRTRLPRQRELPLNARRNSSVSSTSRRSRSRTSNGGDSPDLQTASRSYIVVRPLEP